MAVSAWGMDAGDRSAERFQRNEPDPELAYEELLTHVSECPTCWHWRNQLWAVHRLCPTGAGMADRYAVAEVARRGRGW
jgi:hypothetical protein